MNKHIHRLVFDRLRGMRVPAAETARSAGKQAGGQTRAVAGAMTGVLVLSSLCSLAPAHARTGAEAAVRAAMVARSNNSPLPLWSNRAGGPFKGFREDSAASGFKVNDPNGKNLVIDQYDQRIIINWDSFNIDNGYSVHFQQPTGGSALNRIWDANPTVIMGKLTATGEVILENTNGVIFGRTARIQTGKFVATALKLANETFLKGIRNERDGQAVFGDDDSEATGFITVERGAEIKALAGGDVMLIAPQVYNEGRIETPKGQAILAAGKKVYLYSSTNAAQRGLLVAVDAFADGPAGVNTVENAVGREYKTVNGETVADSTADATTGLSKKINEIVAEQGSINLVGLSIRQNGVLTATTAVKGQNGAIYLQAQKSTVSRSDGNSANYRAMELLGSVELGEESVTRVLASTDKTATQTDGEAFYKSRIDINGEDIRIRGGAKVLAPSGNITIAAASDATSFNQANIVLDNSRVVIEGSASIDAAGLRDVQLSMSRNQLSGRLFANELADSPVQRGGVLYRNLVMSDARLATGVANVTGFYKATARTAEELSTTGGTVVVRSGGTTVVADDALVNVSGGSVAYQAGAIASSLLRKGSALVRLEDASKGVRYDELMTQREGSGSLNAVAGYVEGKDGGTASFIGQRLYLGKDSVKADVVVGPNQRSGPLSGSEAADLAKHPERYASVRPKAGTVSIRSAADATPLDLVQKPTLAIGAVPEFDDASGTAQLDALLDGRIEVVLDNLQHGGVGQLELSGGPLTMASGSQLDLGASGTFKAKVQGATHLDGTIKAAGGSIEVESGGDIVLGSQARLDASGRQVDENGLRAGIDAIEVNGGDVTLEASGSLTMAQGSHIDVSAGAWRSTSGNVSTGSAGSVALAVNKSADAEYAQAPKGELTLGRLSGYDFGTGGTLHLSGMRSLTIGAPADPLGLSLAPEFFSANGFGTFDLKSLGNVTVAAGTQLTPVLKNLVLTGQSNVRGTVPLFKVDTLVAGLRKPINLALSATLQPQSNGELEELAQGGSLTIGKGALVDVGLGGSIKLSAGHSVTVKTKAELRAHAGQVDLSLLGERGGDTTEGSKDKAGYIPDQEVRLQAQSVIDVSGAARTFQGPNGRLTGELLEGGTVSLNYKGPGSSVRGRVVTEAGSTIKVSGGTADLNLSQSSALTKVYSGAGTVKVGASGGFQLEGTFEAWRLDPSVDGGQFIASVSREGLGDAVNRGDAYPQADRVLTLTATAKDIASQPAAYGEGKVSSEQLSSAGFDRISLRADDRVVLGGGASLGVSGDTPLRAIVLSSGALSAADQGSHVLQAAYVGLGNRDILPQQTGTAEAAQATKGDASLSVNAGLIDVHGQSALQGFKEVRLNATLGADGVVGSRRDGEVRFIGRSVNSSSTLKGGLNFDGLLDLTAGQIYATTLSDFTVQGALGNSSFVTHAPGSGSISQTPLTALAKLSIQADKIQHDGVLRQPFGTIELKAVDSISLGKGSALSVSGDGVTVPVGTTINERQWVYSTQGTSSGVDTSKAGTQDLTAGLPVSKGVLVSGPALTIDGEAELKAQAGGDLQAWEFISGAGGTTDTLNRKDVYAVLPNYTYDFAPYDAEIIASTKALGTQLQAGDKISILTDNGVLAKGSYTLLPARYALLPGAVLVSASDVKTSQVLSSAIKQDDGGVHVSGQFTATGTAISGGGDPRQTFLLEPQSTFMAQSGFVLTSLNGMLSEQAGKLGKPTPSLPGDAGRFSFVSTSSFDLAGKFDLRGKDGFSGGQLDIAMPKLALVDSGSVLPAGFKAISAESLDATGADSILLGGTRTGTAEKTTVVTEASDVQILITKTPDPKLPESEKKPGYGELIAVAKDTLTVGDGAYLQSSQPASLKANDITIEGQGAALVVSNRVNTDIKRDVSKGEERGGTLTLGKATLKGPAVQIDASRKLSLSGEAVIDTARFGLGAPRIAVGGVSADASAVSLTGNLLNAVKNAGAMQLRSYGSIDFIGSQAFDARNKDGSPVLSKVILDAPQLRGLGQGTDTVSITAADIVLRNTSGLTLADAPEASSSTLLLRAEPPLRDTVTGGITIEGDGTQHLAFASARLESKGDVVFDGKARLSTQGDITLAASRVTATATANQAGVSSAGVLTVSRLAGSRSLNERRGAGGSLNLSGLRVVQDGVVDVASGRISITGLGKEGDSDTVVFKEKSLTSAAGWTQKVDSDWSVHAPGGDIAVTAKTGDIQLRGTLDVSAPVNKDKFDEGPSAGTVALTATGNAKGEGGNLVLGPNAAIKGAAGSDRLSAAVAVDAQHLKNEAPADHGTLGNLAALLQAGGVHREVNVRVRQDDQSLSRTLQAQRVMLSADTGKLTLGAAQPGQFTIDARAPQGGLIQLSAGKDLVMDSGASIAADSTRVGANGGDVLLASTDGTIRLNQGASISATGDDALDGRVVIRAGRDDAAKDDAKRVRIDPIKATIAAAEIDVEAVRVYQGTQLSAGESTGQVIGQTTIGQHNANLKGKSAAILAALGVAGDSRFHLRSGVELRSTGNFDVNGNWSLGTVVGTEPMFVTIRAAGDLNLKGSLSDGFASAVRSDGVIVGEGSSFRLVAGADMAAANVLATKTGTGNLTLGGANIVRTTSGSIELAAGQNITLEGTGTGVNTTQAAVYVAGRRSELAAGQSFTNPISAAQFTAHGGRLEAVAGGDIVSPAASQLFGNWFYHTGFEPGQLGWWSGFSAFKQGLGSFGGGNVNVVAGGTIKNLGVVAPTSARNVLEGGKRTLLVENGGDVSVRAGGDIQGGVYFLGRGSGLLQARGAITTGDSLRPASIPEVGAVLGLMDGHWSVQAHEGVNVAAVYNPTMFSAPSSIIADDVGAAYYTYEADSSVSIGSVRGGVVWASETTAARNMSAYFSQLHSLFSPASEKISTSSAVNGKNITAASVAPPSVAVTALQGDLTFNTVNGRALTLFPSPVGQLELFAGGNLNIKGTGKRGGLVMADGDVSRWATPGNPLSNRQFNDATPDTSENYALAFILQSKVGDQALPGSTLHANDKQPVHIHAGRDLTLTGDSTAINLPKPAIISAGRDINNLTYTGQHFSAGHITSITAGNNFLGTKNNASFTPAFGLVQVAGPGELQVTAGRQMDLATSGGIKTVGHRYNSALPDEGASLRVAVGMNKTLDLAKWVPLYLDGNPQAQAQLVAHVSEVLNLETDLSFDQALAQYALMSRDHQVEFADRVVRDAFVQTFIQNGGRYEQAWLAKAAALKAKPADYDSRAFKQFKDDVLFAELGRLGQAAAQLPLSANGERRALYDESFKAISLAGVGDGFNFVGDLDLANSSIQTTGAGDQTHGGIDVLVPGGKTLVGLTSFSQAEQEEKEKGISSRISSNRGLVTYGGGSIRAMTEGDFLVNVQKAFVVGDGDILLWSSRGSIDSGKGANTDVTVPPPVAVVTDDGVEFQAAAVTTGSGIGLLKSPGGKSSGTVGLYAPNGEVRALDAAIRNESGGSINLVGVLKGGDNLAGKVVGAPPVVVAPVAVTPNTPPPTETAAGAQEAAGGGVNGKAKEPSSILTVDVLGMGDAAAPGAGNSGATECVPERGAKDGKKDDAKRPNPCTGN